MRFIIIIFLALAIFSCKATTKEKALRIDREQFYKTLYALHQHEGQYEYSYFRGDSLSTEEVKAYDSIFSLTGVTKDSFLEEFDTYLSFYADDLDSLYERMINEFTVIRDSLADKKFKSEQETRTKANNAAPAKKLNKKLLEQNKVEPKKLKIQQENKQANKYDD